MAKGSLAYLGGVITSAVSILLRAYRMRKIHVSRILEAWHSALSPQGLHHIRGFPKRIAAKHQLSEAIPDNIPDNLDISRRKPWAAPDGMAK